MSEDIEPEIDVTNLDDADAHYGLRGSGGIARFNEESLHEHKEALAAEKQRQGVSDTQKLQAVNAGAYDDIEAEIRRVQKEWPTLSLMDATTVARDRVAERERNGEPSPEQAARASRREYMGDSVENLMRADVDVKGGSKPSGRLRKEPKKRPRGRPYETIEDEPRCNIHAYRSTDLTDAALEAIQVETGLNVAALLAGIAMLHNTGSTSALFAVFKVAKAAPRGKTA